jgi:hypothetical protein
MKTTTPGKTASSYKQAGLFASSTEVKGASSTSSDACDVVAVGKRRDGGIRYWRLRHKADEAQNMGSRPKFVVPRMSLQLLPPRRLN